VPQRRPLPAAPVRSLSPARQSAQTKQQAKHLVLATETVMKLLVNGALSAAAVLTLMSLFPYYWTQQAKLQEVREEVQVTEAEVEELQVRFNRSFDPSQAHSVMREQTGLLGPNQRRIVLTNQKPEE
jgi:hypothetical protein